MVSSMRTYIELKKDERQFIPFFDETNYSAIKIIHAKIGELSYWQITIE